jgi:signal transduction histidine kinase
MSSNVPFGTRIVATLLRWRMGKVRALETALRLQGVIQFLLLAVGFVILPAIFLAYFGIASIQDQEKQTQSELEDLSRNVALAFLQEMNSDIIGFEQNVKKVLETGQTPLRTLYTHQRMVLRFDRNMQMNAPFVEHNETKGADVLFHPAYQVGRTIVETDDRTRDNIQYETVQKLLTAGRRVEAKYVLRALLNSQYRHVSGAKLRHLALIELAKDDGLNFGEFRTVTDSILSDPWVVGEGIDGIVAQRFVQDFLDQNPMGSLKPEERTYVDNTRSRIEEQLYSLYWVSRWENEWREVMAHPRQMQPGTLLWEEGEQAIWARTIWDGQTYLFGLHKGDMLNQLREMAETESLRDGLLSMELLAPQSKVPSQQLTRRYIPWLDGWSISVVAQDVSSLEEQSALRRRQKLSLIGFALFVMLFGAILSTRVTVSELRTANIKSNFAASVSHELRSPITQIRLKGESLMFGLIREDELQDNYEAIVRESERLTWLVDNVLDYAAIERDNKSFVLREADLNAVIQRVVDSLQVTLTMRDMEFELELDPELPMMRLDANALSQCVTNLLSNAEKYSREERWIRLKVRRVMGFVEVVVSDKGIGIPIDDIEHIFEPFFRSKEKQALRRKGTGIGLAITKAIMQAHGGTVLVRSQLGNGSTFILQFPDELLVEDELG